MPYDSDCTKCGACSASLGWSCDLCSVVLLCKFTKLDSVVSYFVDVGLRPNLLLKIDA